MTKREFEDGIITYSAYEKVKADLPMNMMVHNGDWEPFKALVVYVHPNGQCLVVAKNGALAVMQHCQEIEYTQQTPVMSPLTEDQFKAMVNKVDCLFDNGHGKTVWGKLTAIKTLYPARFCKDNKDWYPYCTPSDAPKYRAYEPGEMPSNWVDKSFRKKGATAWLAAKSYDRCDTNLQLSIESNNNWKTNETLFREYEARGENGTIETIGVRVD